MDNEQYRQATIATSSDLHTIAHSKTVREMSKLSLPEISGLVARIARVAPAGNVPGVILNGLANLPKRGPTEENVRRDIGLLFRGVEQALKDRAVYICRSRRHHFCLPIPAKTGGQKPGSRLPRRHLAVLRRIRPARRYRSPHLRNSRLRHHPAPAQHPTFRNRRPDRLGDDGRLLPAPIPRLVGKRMA